MSCSDSTFHHFLLLSFPLPFPEEEVWSHCQRWSLEELDRHQQCFLKTINVRNKTDWFNNILVSYNFMMLGFRGWEKVWYLPSAHTACSHTLRSGEERSATKCGTAPAFTTAFVCSEVPEAMFVRAQADSNCRRGSSLLCKNSTILGITPASMSVSIGGFLSRERIFRAA